MQGLTLPRLSASDPEVAGEGGLDPLRLGPLADRLANEIAPDVRARMLRIRFVTAMAAAASCCEGIDDEVVARDGVSTAPIAFEWILIESFVRRYRNKLPSTGIPGTQKAIAVVLGEGQRLTARSYLKSPRVFGFHGIYKPLATGLGIVDTDLQVGPTSGRLLRAWEAERGLKGFLDREAGSAGGKLAREIASGVRQSLSTGACSVVPGSQLWSRLAAAFGPTEAGPREREVLQDLLLDGEQPVRTELCRLLIDESAGSERELLGLVKPRAGKALRARLEAIDAYERLARVLEVSFRALCYISATEYGTAAVPLTRLTRDDELIRAASECAPRYEKALASLEAIGHGLELEQELGAFQERMSVADWINTLMARHEFVQSEKPPTGKRPWFDEIGSGWVVRTPYRIGVRPELDDRYNHPFRATALKQFMEDVS